MTDEELSISDATLIARLRKADEYEPLGHDGWEAADRIYNLGLLHDMAEAKVEALVKARREDALELLAAHGQAQDAYEAQLKAEAKLATAVDALRAFNSFDDLPTEVKRPDIFEINVRLPILRALAELTGGKDE